MDKLRSDNIDSAKQASPAAKLSQALDMMAYGLKLERQRLKRIRPDASAEEIDQAFDEWLFNRD